MINRKIKLHPVGAGLFQALAIGVWLIACSGPDNGNDMLKPSTLPDLSGLSWVEDDLFIGVHDAKNNTEKENWPRVSLIRLPQSELYGVIWQVVDLTFPGPGGASSDMESICSIPGGKEFLLVESGQEGAAYSRIFHALYADNSLAITSYTEWPVEITNVEATEVCQVGQQLVFFYAERAEDSSSTKIRWADLTLAPISFGEFKEIVYEGIDPVGEGARPIVAMDIDSDGFIYIISAYDSGSDDGPYRSVAWQIGRVIDDGEGHATVELGIGKRLGTLDGLKVESITIRELTGGNKQIFIGTDDEHYGGILRLLPEMP
jgi:hypothetical protein